MCVDPVDGIKGKTWGPSTMQKDRYRPTTSILGNDRCCKSAPNIQKSLCHLGGHSNIGALQELGTLSVHLHWRYYYCYYLCIPKNGSIWFASWACPLLSSAAAYEGWSI